MDSTDDQRAAFVRALARQLEAVDRRSFCQQVADISGESFTPQALDHWLRGATDPGRRKVFAAEEALGLAPGALSRHLGYLPLSAMPATTIEQVVKQDTRLKPRDREALVGLHRVLIGEA